jgi:hypothetical protein
MNLDFELGIKIFAPVCAVIALAAFLLGHPALGIFFVVVAVGAFLLSIFFNR